MRRPEEKRHHAPRKVELIASEAEAIPWPLTPLRVNSQVLARTQKALCELLPDSVPAPLASLSVLPQDFCAYHSFFLGYSPLVWLPVLLVPALIREAPWPSDNISLTPPSFFFLRDTSQDSPLPDPVTKLFVHLFRACLLPLGSKL